jgi:hypothetical protein
MRKTHFVTDDILCNMCGDSCRNTVCPEHYEGLVEVTVQGEYGAQLGDLVAYTFSMCEPCQEAANDDAR